ncbi:MAG: hypothetical protein RIS94_1552 [Pseudomonadota bacterium]
MTPAPFPLLEIADGIGIAVVGDVVVVLDIHRNRYSLARGKAASILAAASAGEPVDPGSPEASALCFHHWLAPAGASPGPWFNPNELPMAEASVLEGGDTPVRTRAIDLRIATICLKTRLDLRFRPLSRILRGLPMNWRGRSMVDLVAAARLFDRARRRAPFTPRCLPDALAFLRFVRARGHAAHLVFGVKLHPFEAHCWAQSGGVVLTDPLDRIRRFVPILAV